MLQKIREGASVTSDTVARALLLSLILCHLILCSTAATPQPVSAETTSTATTSNPATMTSWTTSTNPTTQTTSWITSTTLVTTTSEDSTVKTVTVTTAATTSTSSSFEATTDDAATSKAATSKAATSKAATAAGLSFSTPTTAAGLSFSTPTTATENNTTSATTFVSAAVATSGTSTSVIVGAVVGSVLGAVLILVVILIAVHFIRKKRNKDQPPTLPDPNQLSMMRTTASRREKIQQPTAAITEPIAPDKIDDIDLQIHTLNPEKSKVDASRCAPSIYINDAVLGYNNDTRLDSNGNKPPQDAEAVVGSLELDVVVPSPTEQPERSTDKQHVYVNVANPHQPVYVNIDPGSNATAR